MTSFARAPTPIQFVNGISITRWRIRNSIEEKRMDWRVVVDEDVQKVEFDYRKRRNESQEEMQIELCYPESPTAGTHTQHCNKTHV